MTFFRKKLPTPTISDDIFSHRPNFFRFYLSVLCEMLYITFIALSWREKPLFIENFLDDTFFNQFVLSNASDYTTSRNIGGRMHGPSPTSQIFLEGDCPPVLPKSPPMPLGGNERLWVLVLIQYWCCFGRGRKLFRTCVMWSGVTGQ